MSIRSVALLLYFVGSLPVCFLRPFYGVLLWTAIAFLSPHAFLWGAAANYPWAMVVAIPTIAGALLFTSGWMRRLTSPAIVLLAVFWIWTTVTSILSSHNPLFMHHAGDTWERWDFVSKVLLMMFLTVSIVDNFARVRTLVLVLAGCFGFYVVKVLPLILTGGQFRLYGPENSMIADNNDFGLALNMTVPLFFFLAQSETKRWVKWLFIFLFAISIPAVFFTYSRGSLVAVAVTVFLMFLRSRQRLILIPVIAVGLVLAMVYAPKSWKERMDPTKDQIDGSAKGRLNAWSFAWNLASEYPVAGGGYSTFTTELFSRYAPSAVDFHGPHSVYFQLLGEHGFVGLGLYLLVIACAFTGGFRLAGKARARGDTIVLNYINLFQFSLIAFMVNGAFLGRAYFDYFFTILACLAILPRIVHDKWEQEDEDQEAEEGSIDTDESELLSQTGVPLWNT